MRDVCTATGATRRWTSIVVSCAAPTTCAGTTQSSRHALRVWRSSFAPCTDALPRAQGLGIRSEAGTTLAPCARPPIEASQG
eukprot:666135-Amphidinium_carterae.1